MSFFRWMRVLMLGLLSLGSSKGATLIFTNVPSYGSAQALSGLVEGADPSRTAVAVFIYVPGYGWVSKPTCAQQLTPIHPDGSWSAAVVTGGSDQLATRMAAALVSTNYNGTCVQGTAYLPANVLAQTIATAIITRENPSANWLRFSGYDWWIKSAATLVGPGPNYFSDSATNVWTDKTGQLHLRLTQVSNHWQCAEVVSARTFGYGSYRFELNTAVNGLDPNAVLGLFTWSDDPSYTHREIDIEESRWSNPTDPNNSQFVVQPFDVAGHLARFAVPGGVTNVTAWFSWQSNQVTFECVRGSYSARTNRANLIYSWTYTGAVPQTGDENVRINLWLNNTQPPAGNVAQEIIVKSFQFVPLGNPPAAALTNMKAGNQPEFRLDCQPDWRYQIQSSADLSTWQVLTELTVTNFSQDFLDTISGKANQRFYRTVTLP
jgi:hypothetical protein